MVLQQTVSDNPWLKFNEWGDTIAHRWPIFLTALVFIILVFILSRFVKIIATKILHRRDGNAAIATVMASFISIIFITIGIFITLGILGLNQTVTSLLAGAGILGLILGLALQDTLSSAIAGIIMTTRKSYKVGDFVDSNGFLGIIVELNLRNTTIRQTNGVDVKIPNKLVLGNPLINYTLNGEIRIDINIGISYNEDLHKIESLIQNAFKEVNYNNKKELEIYFTELAPGSIKLLIRFWISKFKQIDQLRARSEAVKKIKEIFEANGVVVPNPFINWDTK